MNSSPGGFTMLYRASRHGRLFAIKALKPEWRESGIHKALLRKEYEILMGLSHPNIVIAFSYEHIEGLGYCIVEEWVEGVTLDRYIESHHATHKEVTRVLTTLCDVLEYVHSCQIIHRDLKPRNILVTKAGGVLKLIDFGIADGPAVDMIKGPGGTPGYAAPEQYNAGNTSDHKADIYSFGKILDSLGLCPKTARACTSEAPEDRPSVMTEVAEMLKRESQPKGRKILYTSMALGIIALVTGWAVYSYREKSVPIVSPDSLPVQTAEITADMDTDHVITAPEVAPVQNTLPAATPPANTETVASAQTEMMPANTEAVASAQNEIMLDVLAKAYQTYTERLQEEAARVAERHFRTHIAIGDTVTVSPWLRRYYVGYWRHLSKCEMQKWIEDHPNPIMRAEDAMKISCDIIMDYSAKHDSEHHAGWKRIVDRLGYDPVFVYQYCADELPDGSLVIYTREEDDEWHRSIEPRRTRQIRY